MTKDAQQPPAVTWKNQPDDHDYPAAASYLSLLGDPKRADQLAEKLRAAPLVTYKAKDLLRASRLDLLPLDDPHVIIDLRKVVSGTALSPVLIVRGDLKSGLPTTIADGYHRICASYHLSENTDIPCRVIDL